MITFYKSTKMKDKPKEVFNMEEIEDVRIIIKAKGKNYAITPKKEFGKEVAKQMRLLCADYALQMHDIVVPALEDIKKTTNILSTENQ